MTLFHDILLPLDVADPVNADRAIEAARTIAGASGGNVHLLHVRYFMPTTYREFLPPNFDATEQKECEAALESWAEQLGLPEDRVTRTLRRGSVAPEALEEAEKRNADLIIIGSHMPSFTSKLMGSNATAMVRDAKTSVLIIRSETAG